jgi:hypothetical protein
MMRAEKYKAGEVVITEGQRGGDAYVVERGHVEVFRAGPPELALAVLGPGQIFGEMGLITEQPRSASVRALEDVEVGVLAREEFLDHLRSAPDALLPFLRTLAERIRNLNTLVEELARRSASNRDAMRAHLGVDAPIADAATQTPGLRVTVEGLTPRATEALDGRAVLVDQFPYRIGRRTAPDDPFSANELAIPDTAPWWISRNHCMISHVDDRCFLIDRGSRLGTLVDGKMVGGGQQAARLSLPPGDHEVRLGGALTPFRFGIVVSAGEVTANGRRGTGAGAHLSGARKNGRRRV